MKKILLFITFSIAIMTQTLAQQTTLISKEEVTAKAVANNNSIKISEQEFLEAKADFDQTKAVFFA